MLKELYIIYTKHKQQFARQILQEDGCGEWPSRLVQNWTHSLIISWIPATPAVLLHIVCLALEASSQQFCHHLVQAL